MRVLINYCTTKALMSLYILFKFKILKATVYVVQIIWHGTQRIAINKTSFKIFSANFPGGSIRTRCIYANHAKKQMGYKENNILLNRQFFHDSVI